MQPVDSAERVSRRDRLQQPQGRSRSSMAVDGWGTKCVRPAVRYRQRCGSVGGPGGDLEPNRFVLTTSTRGQPLPPSPRDLLKQSTSTASTRVSLLRSYHILPPRPFPFLRPSPSSPLIPTLTFPSFHLPTYSLTITSQWPTSPHPHPPPKVTGHRASPTSPTYLTLP